MDITYSINEVDDVAKKLIEAVNSKTILLHGSMSVGKTTLVKSIAKVLGSTDTISSPTFSIVNEYQINNGILYHFDLYRIVDIEETYNFGIEDYLYSENWILIEWPEIIKSILADNFNEVFLKKISQKTRKIKLKT